MNSTLTPKSTNTSKFI